MRDEIKQLIQLQNLDTMIRKLQAIRDKLKRDAADAERGAQSEKQNLENRTAEAKTFRKAIDKREGDLKDLEARILKLETDLNKVKTNKEYAAIQHEILGIKADKSKAEDEILKMMEQTEAHLKELKDLSKKAEEATAAVVARNKALSDAIADAEARIENTRAERAALAAAIPPSYLVPYERLLQKADGRAVVACRNYICEGCRMSLTANTVSLLMGGDKLVYCHSCGRILYVAADEDLTGIATAGRKESW